MDGDYVAAYRDLYRNHWWWRVREEVLLETVRRTLPGRDGGARILDIGCGAGLFFDALEPFGHVEGVEADETAVAQSGRWRGRIHAGGLETFTPSAPFDLILMLDVIEHVDAPLGMLRLASTMLAPGGRVVVTVPAFDALWTSHDDLNRHVRRYTAGALRRLLAGAGLRVAASRYLFPSLVVPKLLVRVKETIFRSSPSIPRVPSPAVNAALAAWFRCENAVAGFLPFGGSVMAVAERAPDEAAR